jgi:NADPH-dependent F420 reductase
MTETLPMLAVLGGTGAEGFGLAVRWAAAGYDVTLGSRVAERAAEKAAEIAAMGTGWRVQGMENLAAAERAEIVALTVPYGAHQPTLAAVRAALQGKILIDVTVPLVPPKVSRVQLPAGKSAGEEAQALLGDGVRVVSAFQNISASHLVDLQHEIDCDVLVCGDDADAREAVVRLAAAAGMVAWHAGPLANAVAVESLTPVLISLNRRYKVPNSGIRITGIPRGD